MASSGSASGSAPVASFIRVESIQVCAQSVPSIAASVPQVVAPSSGTGVISGGPPLHAHATLSPLAPLTHAAASALAAAVEARLKTLVRTAQGFMRHAQRRVLATDDLNLALRHKSCAPLFGFDSSSLGVIGGAGGAAPTGADLFTAAGEDLFLLRDPLVHFDDLLAQPLPPAPADTTFSMHWLAIDGVQPLIPENPGLEDEADAATSAASNASTTVLLDKGEKEVLTKAPIKHVLSKEQALYYEYVTSALRGNDSTLKKAVFKSLSEDDGLYQLLPYFTQFIAEEVSRNLHNLPLLNALMKMANCVLHSPYLHVDPYLHQLVPPILTCIVGKQLCLEAFEDHWALRDYASDMLLFVCQRYSHTYPSLQPRVTKTLVKAWMDPTRSLNTHYGCVTSLRKLGQIVVKRLVVPYVTTYFDLLQPALNSTSDATRMEANFVYQALLSAVGEYIRWELDASLSSNEMVTAVQAAANAAKNTMANALAPSPAATDSSSTAMEDVVVKQEDGSTSQKKRRRSSPPVGVQPTSILSSPLLPDREALIGIEQLLELFGEALTPHVQTAVRIAADKEAARLALAHPPQQQQQQEQPAAAAAISRAGKIVFNRNNIAAATAFI